MKNGKYKSKEFLKGDKMKRILFLLGLIVVLIAPIMSEALPVPIVNPGFEVPTMSDGTFNTSIDGWSVLYGRAGTFNPTSSNFSSSVPEGNVSWLNRSTAIAQTLDYWLTPETQLTLSVDVGWRLNEPSSPLYSIALWAGGQQLASESLSSLIYGGFQTVTLTYDVLASNLLIGERVSIVLSNLGRTTSDPRQVNFDNVSLENHSRASVPEPSTLLLLGSGLLGFGIFARKRRK